MVRFEQVGPSNYQPVLALKLGEAERFMQPLIHQLALSYLYPGKIPLAVLKDGEVVGFASYEIDQVPEKAYDILIFVLDENQRGNGLGREVMAALLNYFKTQGKCTRVTLNYSPENEVAGRFYRAMGFEATGRSFGSHGEIVMAQNI